jgi:glutathione S-transferase
MFERIRHVVGPSRMSETITFYHNPMSRGRIVHWMLEEIGAPYDVKLLDWEKREHKSPEYLAINPMGKIPTIVHRGTVITETAAILTYLADAFPAAGLAPAIDDPQRGTYLRWLFWAAGCMEPAMMDKSLGRPPASRPGAIGYGTYEDTMATLEKAIAPGPYILGDRFSTADLYLSATLGYGIMTKAIDPTPTIGAYVARCNERPAFQRVMGGS